MYNYISTVVLNSGDQHEKTWRPAFKCLNNMPHNMRTLPKKPTEMHW